MTRRKVTTILGVVLACAFAANEALAQPQATTTNGTQRSGGQDQSAAAMAQEAANPFSSGKLCRCGGTPTLFQLQVEYYPVHPNVGRQTWNIQLQATPTIPALIKRTLF